MKKNTLRIEHWPLERLAPYARNARTHDDAQIQKIAASIRAYGFVNPLLVGNDGNLAVDDHGRFVLVHARGETDPRKGRFDIDHCESWLGFEQDEHTTPPEN